MLHCMINKTNQVLSLFDDNWRMVDTTLTYIEIEVNGVHYTTGIFC